MIQYIQLHQNSVIKPTPAFDKITDVAVAPKTTTASIDSKIEIRVSFIRFFFFEL